MVTRYCRFVTTSELEKVEDCQTFSLCRHQGIYKKAEMADVKDKDELHNTCLHSAYWRAVSNQQFDVEIDGSCPSCAVDWCFTRTRYACYINSWHDFGSEGSPLDAAWSVHTYESVHGHHLVERHEPGSVRRSYGKRPQLRPQDYAVEKYWTERGY
ncbi:hypothetical protein HJFPF1_10987 [Paramyrothecium foliicola]|nr:hypothetical protein HJFPF1_10987 [Paramyrothecium foliicola]